MSTVVSTTTASRLPKNAPRRRYRSLAPRARRICPRRRASRRLCARAAPIAATYRTRPRSTRRRLSPTEESAVPALSSRPWCRRRCRAPCWALPTQTSPHPGGRRRPSGCPSGTSKGTPRCVSLSPRGPSGRERRRSWSSPADPSRRGPCPPFPRRRTRGRPPSACAMRGGGSGARGRRVEVSGGGTENAGGHGWQRATGQAYRARSSAIASFDAFRRSSSARKRSMLARARDFAAAGPDSRCRGFCGTPRSRADDDESVDGSTR